MMETRRLGRTELKVTALGVGTLGFPRVQAHRKEIVAILKRALDEGINIIDTALVYSNGEMEKCVGEALEGRRSECIVLSRSVCREPEKIAADVETSLRNLKSDYVDVYQLHDVTRPADVAKADELLSALAKVREQGKVRFIGVSTHGAPDDVRAMIASGAVDVLTIAYNVTQHKRQLGDGEDLSRTATDVLPFAKEHDVGVTVMKPLGGGRLTQTGPSGEAPLDPVKAIRYVMQNPFVATVTPGVGTMDELLQDLKAADPANALSEGQMRALEEEGRKWGVDFCRQCGYCLPCTNGLPIPRLMILAQQLRAGSDAQKIKAAFDELKLPPEGCSMCGKCEERCPYGLPIQERLKEVFGALG